MANYFEDFRSGAKDLIKRGRGNKTLKGIDDYFDRISAGGGKGWGDFAMDMSGIADMYQVGKQGLHIADDMYDGADWDEVDQGRKDALGRGALGTALTLAPIPGFGMAKAGIKAGLGAAKRGAKNTISTAFRDVGARRLLPSPGTAQKGAKKMREALQKNLAKASSKGRERLVRSKAIANASNRQVKKAYNTMKGIKAPGLGGKYMAHAGDNVFKKGLGLPLRMATGGGLTGPLYRAGKVGLKDLWRNEPGEGMYDSLSNDELVALGDQMRNQIFPSGATGGPGKEGQEGPDGDGLTMEDYVAMGFEGDDPSGFLDPRIGDAISSGSVQAFAAAEKLNEGRPLPKGYGLPSEPSGGSESKVPGGLRQVLKEADAAEAATRRNGLSAPDGPVWDPRRGEYVRAESLTPEERASFADVTSAKDMERNKRLDTHDEKGRLHDNVDRYAIDRQNQARKTFKNVQEGYNRDDDMQEIMRANGMVGDGGFRGEPGELGRVPTGSGVEDFRRRNIESSRIPEGYSSSANRGLPESEIQRQIAAHKVAQDNQPVERPSNADLLNPFKNPFYDTMSDARRSELEHAQAQGLDDLDFGEEDEMQDPDTNTFVQDLDGSTEHTTDYVDPNQPVFDDNPEWIEDSNSTDFADPNEPTPDPDAEAERWNRENPFAGADEPPAIPPPQPLDTSYNSPIEALDLPPALDFPPEPARPSTNGTSTKIRNLNDPVGDTSVSDEEMREIELMLEEELQPPAQWEGDLMLGGVNDWGTGIDMTRDDIEQRGALELSQLPEREQIERLRGWITENHVNTPAEILNRARQFPLHPRAVDFLEELSKSDEWANSPGQIFRQIDHLEQKAEASNSHEEREEIDKRIAYLRDKYERAPWMDEGPRPILP